MVFSDFTLYSAYGYLAIRLAVGIIFIYHAMPKLKDPKVMAKGMGMEKMTMLPMVLGGFEFISGLAMILGTYVQEAALILIIVMTGALYFKISKWKVPFSAYDKPGWEFDFVLLAANIFILVNGGGPISLMP